MSSYGAFSQLQSTMPLAFTLQLNASTTGTGNSLSVLGYATALLSITGTFGSGTNTIVFEVSSDGGSTWVPIVGTAAGGTGAAQNASAAGDWLFNVAGYNLLRARITSVGSGSSITVKGYTSVLTFAALVPAQIATYSACSTTASFAPPTNPQDIFSFIGSSTKTCKIQRIRLFLSSISSEYTSEFFLIKRKGTTIGGAYSTVTAVAFDSSNQAATGSLVYWTSAPTPATFVGNISIPTIVSPLNGATGFYVPPFFDLFVANGTTQPITVRGTTELVSLNFNGVALPTNLKIKMEVVWTEE